MTARVRKDEGKAGFAATARTAFDDLQPRSGQGIRTGGELALLGW